jgi:transcriptional regulator with XRE-family HTH domain
MSTSPEPGYIPEWDMADRMRKTLRDSGQSVGAVAEYFGVNRNTIGNWINGHITPDLTTQRLWAMKFGVPLEWLQTGVEPHDDPNRLRHGKRDGYGADISDLGEYRSRKHGRAAKRVA